MFSAALGWGATEIYATVGPDSVGEVEVLACFVEGFYSGVRVGGEGIVVEFKAGELEVPGFTYVYSDASPLMFGFTPGVAHVSAVYRMTQADPLTIASVDVENLAP